jgi:hypothetical protein
MSSQNNGSMAQSLGGNSAGFTTGLEGQQAMLPTTLGGSGYSTLGGTGLDQSQLTGLASAQTPGYTQTDAYNSNPNLIGAQRSLATAANGASMLAPKQQQSAARGGAPRLQATQFDGLSGQPVAGGTQGGSALLQLMQQLKG